MSLIRKLTHFPSDEAFRSVSQISTKLKNTMSEPLKMPAGNVGRAKNEQTQITIKTKCAGLGGRKIKSAHILDC